MSAQIHGSRATLKTFVKSKAGTSPALILTIKNFPGSLAALAFNVPTDFLFRNFVSSKEKSSALCSLALDSSPRALRACWFSNTEFYKRNKKPAKAGICFAIKNSPGCLARSRLTAFRVLLMCFQHNRKSAPASARSRWTLTIASSPNHKNLNIKKD